MLIERMLSTLPQSADLSFSPLTLAIRLQRSRRKQSRPTVQSITGPPTCVKRNVSEISTEDVGTTSDYILPETRPIAARQIAFTVARTNTRRREHAFAVGSYMTTAVS